MITRTVGSREAALPTALEGCPSLVGEEPPPLPDPAATIEKALARPVGARSLALWIEPGDRVAIVVDSSLPAHLGAMARDAASALALGAGASEVSTLQVTGCSYDGGAEEGACLPAAWARSLGVVRLRSEVVQADKVVLIEGSRFDPLQGLGGGGALLALGCTDPRTRGALLSQVVAPLEERGVRSPLSDAPSARSSPLTSSPLTSSPLTSSPLTSSPLTSSPLTSSRQVRVLPLDEGGSPRIAAQLATWRRRMAVSIASVLTAAPPTFLLQLALQRRQRLAGVFAGDPTAAYRSALAFQRRWRTIPFERPLDGIVVLAGASASTLSEALPPLIAGCEAVRDGGAVILIATCGDGVGGMDRALLQTIIASLQRWVRITLVSDLASEAPQGAGGLQRGDAARLGLQLAPDLAAALSCSQLDDGRLASLEWSGSTPRLRDSSL